MEPLLGVKIGCLFALLALTLVCGLIPICVKWFQIEGATGRHRRVLSLLGCISAGVFLGAGFMHMTAEALEGIESEIQKFVMQNRTESEGNFSDDASSDHTNYPYGELIISLGFFLVFLVESLALQCCPGAAGGSKTQEEECGGAHVLGLHSHGSLPSPSRSPFRALILLLSLSFHSVFEGLAVGLQTTVVATVQLCVAVLAHKGLVVFGVGLRLVQAGTGTRWATFSILSFALMSPLGVAIGLAVAAGDSEGGRGLAQAVLEGVAAGTFLYVTFLEILPRELVGPEAPLAKWGCVAAGFAFMAFIALWA
ncbi:solute carrier family 39 member 2 [Rhinolophus ferrumequinum]|uniref:Solute carrier family 39 member 2 n=1 Tax=Rhinolophus ferrumequinum TaxID=59479 RepID=A0A671FL60_RHIFE|nr:zinc transporter ZIP2 isoform X1 [Rhinolophus ferrumequinum]KAF6352446.1 solute carrier family 39 member 2 [Rhinolophus ferrumequinum]